MGAFEYEWYTVQIRFRVGVITCEYKAKSKENAIRQIKKEVQKDDLIVEVLWETLKLDRKGYQRLY